MKNFGWKTLSLVLALIISALTIVAFSPRAYTPMLFAASTLDFANTAAGTATDLTVTVTGSADGDIVMLGIPNGSTVGNGAFVAWISASNTVTVRFINNNLLTALNPASGSFNVIVIKKS